QILGISGWVDVGTADGADGQVGTDGGAVTDAPGGNEGSPGDDGPCQSPVEGGMAGVLITSIAGARPYCIDSTETTMALYQRFLDDPTINPPQGAPPECAWNTAYGFEYLNVYKGDPRTPELPVTTVNWCDAWGFCHYWGKRLCGNRTDGGPVEVDAAGTVESEWYYACSGPNDYGYPYGPTYQAGLCRDDLAEDAGPGVVPNKTCVGSVPGLYDMSGNLAEWENSCSSSGTGDPRQDACLTRGGTFFFKSDSVTCGLTNGGAVNPRGGGPLGSAAVTIRCCWDP
ncbi:MAG TPA: SUMF1/EgtB/PvdO family nonheme iron enzyme, partial [Polyangiaceae bacterium]